MKAPVEPALTTASALPSLTSLVATAIELFGLRMAAMMAFSPSLTTSMASTS